MEIKFCAAQNPIGANVFNSIDTIDLINLNLLNAIKTTGVTQIELIKGNSFTNNGT